MKMTDENAGLKGIWKLEVFEGDVRREKLPIFKRLHNFFRKVFGKLPCHLGATIGTPIQVIEGENLIVTVGKQMILDRLFGLSAVGAMTQIGVGTSATAAAIGDTALTGADFNAFDATPTRSSLTVTSIATFGTGDANFTWNELGMNNGTTLLNRIAPIGPFTKSAAVSIVVTVLIVQA